LETSTGNNETVTREFNVKLRVGQKVKVKSGDVTSSTARKNIGKTLVVKEIQDTYFVSTERGCSGVWNSEVDVILTKLEQVLK
jgi:hypothetical protein